MYEHNPEFTAMMTLGSLYSQPTIQLPPEDRSQLKGGESGRFLPTDLNPEVTTVGEFLQEHVSRTGRDFGGLRVEAGRLTAQKVSELAGRSENTARRYLDEYVDRGLLIDKGTAGKKMYALNRDFFTVRDKNGAMVNDQEVVERAHRVLEEGEL